MVHTLDLNHRCRLRQFAAMSADLVNWEYPVACPIKAQDLQIQRRYVRTAIGAQKNDPSHLARIVVRKEAGHRSAQGMPAHVPGRYGWVLALDAQRVVDTEEGEVQKW